MKIIDINSKLFRSYGRVLKGYDFAPLIEEMKRSNPLPTDGFVYKASSEELEKTEAYQELKNRGFGGMPMQLGYCNGVNSKLNCLEYHKTSEICIMADDAILLLGLLAEAEDLSYDASKVKAFFVPAGMGVELFSTTLHYAPCSAEKGKGYRVANALPLGTNAAKPQGLKSEGEDLLCMGTNKWLFAHKDAPEAKEAYIGLLGENVELY